jgi:hypothetical protein
MKIPAPSHSTVVAYLALFVALGGSAYAVSKIGSGEIENRSVRGKDVANDTLGGRQVDEAKLSGPLAVGDERSGTCDPIAGAPVDCIGQTITLPRESALLVMGTASKGAQPGSGVCAMNVDGTQSNGEALGGPESDGFALTKVTPLLDRGPHTVALTCTESNSNFTLNNPTIAAVAVGEP